MKKIYLLLLICILVCLAVLAAGLIYRLTVLWGSAFLGLSVFLAVFLGSLQGRLDLSEEIARMKKLDETCRRSGVDLQ
jgi:hypothetical protein